MFIFFCAPLTSDRYFTTVTVNEYYGNVSSATLPVGIIHDTGFPVFSLTLLKAAGKRPFISHDSRVL